MASMTANVPISDTGTAIKRDQRGADIAQEQEDHDHHQHERLDQGVDHLIDALEHERRRIVGRLVGDALRELGLHALHDRLDAFGRRQGVGAGRLEDGDQGTRAAVEAAERVGGPCPKLDPADVAHAHERAVRVGPDHDVGELLGLGQPALGLDVELELGVAARLGADAADGRLDVLALQRLGDVVRRQAECRHPVGADPDPHAVVERAEQIRVTDTRDPLDAVQHVDRGVVAEEQRVVALVRRVDRQHLQDGGRLLLDRDALPPDVLGQLRHRQLHPVVDVDGVDVRVGADGETDGERVAAVIAGGRLHVERLVDAHDLRSRSAAPPSARRRWRRHRDSAP